ncbi:MAG: hypothetical protein WCK17_12645, partial [Verrucomicrobiota bacterium]
MNVLFSLKHSLFTAGAFALSTLPLSVQAAPAPPPSNVVSEQKAADLFRRPNLAAWCIVPFDKAKRNPEQRAEMLERLGFT